MILGSPHYEFFWSDTKKTTFEQPCWQKKSRSIHHKSTGNKQGLNPTAIQLIKNPNFHENERADATENAHWVCVKGDVSHGGVACGLAAERSVMVGQGNVTGMPQRAH